MSDAEITTERTDRVLRAQTDSAALGLVPTKQFPFFCRVQL